MSYSLATLVLMAIFLGAIFLFGAQLYSTASTNCIANGCNYTGATNAYPLIVQSNNFTTSAGNFTNTLMNATQSSTSNPIAANPLTFLVSTAPAIIGLIWSMLTLVLTFMLTGVGAMAGASVAGVAILPSWTTALVVLGISLAFIFGALAYALRWFV